MARKVFISFLGTSNYKEEGYYFNNDKSTATEPLRFVQEATLKLICNDYNAEDAVYVFLTEQSRKLNWEDYEHTENIHTGEKAIKEGLKSRLSKMYLKCSVFDKDVSEGKSEEEIWEIFQQIFDCLKVNDKVYFDITHGFRSSPLLTLSLINYAKFLKNIELKGIFYGAYEAGDRKLRISPIWDLVSFSAIQEWTNAASIFIKLGNSSVLSELTKNEIKPLLRSQNDKTNIARQLNQLLKSLDNVTNSLQTNRGSEIVKANIFRNLTLHLDHNLQENFIVPMKPILEKVRQKISNFSKIEDWKNGFTAVEWCINHNLIQQGITMLQESIFTYYCVLHGLDYQCESDRSLVSSCFFIRNNKLENNASKWNEIAQLNAVKVIEILSTIPIEIATDYDSLTQSARNDINHGGFSKNSSPENLKNKLENSFISIKKYLNIE
jgi:CRISPR-associated Csx2 family protein